MDERTELINKICNELDCLLTNACDFIFTDDETYDALERNEISKIIYKYRDRLLSENNK